MNLETLKALPDSEIEQLIAWGQQELKARADKRKADTIAKIKQLAGSIGVRVAIGGAKGRLRKADRKRSRGGQGKPQ